MPNFHQPTTAEIAATKTKLDDVLARHREQGWEDYSHPDGFWEGTIAKLNENVNDYCVYKKEQHGVWQTPQEFLIREEGDCEEFALTKTLMLAELGHVSWFCIGYDWVWRDFHAVCLVKGPNTVIKSWAGAPILDTRLVLDIPGIPRWGPPWTVARYEMTGVMRFIPEMIWRIGYGH